MRQRRSALRHAAMRPRSVNLILNALSAMHKKYKIDSLNLEKTSFADLFDKQQGPSFADLEQDYQPALQPFRQPAFEGKQAKRRSLGQLARIEPQSQLDLHGLTAAEAENKTRNYLLTQKKNGRTVVRIITGKGLHSPGPNGVLRDLVEQILLQAREDGLLVRFDWEKQNKEKSGAVLVQLR